LRRNRKEDCVQGGGVKSGLRLTFFAHHVLGNASRTAFALREEREGREDHTNQIPRHVKVGEATQFGGVIVSPGWSSPHSTDIKKKKRGLYET